MRQRITQHLHDFAAWLARTHIELVQPSSITSVRKPHRLVGHSKDAVVLAAALDAGIDYLVTLDGAHMLNNPSLRSALDFPVGTPGDCLAWFRGQESSPV